jgi:hypothetical protein
MSSKSNAPAGGQGALKIRLSRTYTSNCPTASYQRLCFGRFLDGLLDPFICIRCHRVSLDPIARNSKRQFLCQSCADSELPTFGL